MNKWKTKKKMIKKHLLKIKSMNEWKTRKKMIKKHEENWLLPNEI